jgi:predicted DNA-binding protein (UPF0278 family)
MGVYEDNLNYWAFRGRSAKTQSERAAAKQIHDIMKHHGKLHQDRAYDIIRTLRDKYRGNILVHAYQRGMDDTLKVISITHGTPSRNIAKKIAKRYRK